MVLSLYLAFAVPRLKAKLAAFTSLLLVIALIGAQIGLMVAEGIWLPMTIAAVFLALGHAFMTVKKFNITEHLKQTSEVEGAERSEEHTSELQSLMRNSYAVLCLKKKQTQNT